MFYKTLKSLEQSGLAVSNRKLTPYLRYPLVALPLFYSVYERITLSGLGLWLASHFEILNDNWLPAVMMEWILLLLISLPLMTLLARVPALQTAQDSRIAERRFAAWVFQHLFLIFASAVTLIFGGVGGFFWMCGALGIKDVIGAPLSVTDEKNMGLAILSGGAFILGIVGSIWFLRGRRARGLTRQ